MDHSTPNKPVVHIDEDCTTMTGEHLDEVFSGCTFNQLNNLTLKNCDLSRSKFVTEDIRKAMGLTVTLNCLSFNEVELSPLLFDLILLLLTKTNGNDRKREKLFDVIGHSKAKYYLALLNHLE